MLLGYVQINQFKQVYPITTGYYLNRYVVTFINFGNSIHLGLTSVFHYVSYILYNQTLVHLMIYSMMFCFF